MEEAEFIIRSLEPRARAKARGRIKLLGDHGHILRMPYSRYIIPEIFELRIVGKDNIRLIYTFKSDVAIIFHAFVKKTEGISLHEMHIIKQKFNSLRL